MNKLSKFDIIALNKIRQNIENFIKSAAEKYEENGCKILDIAPQNYKGARQYFKNSFIETLDIEATSGATYIADLCNCREIIAQNSYDLIFCTEVLEHTLQPFSAVDCIYHMLKPGGYVFVSTPYNFRIHGPLPDCWRFTEYGLKELFKKFDIIEIKGLETPGRWLMPLQYTLIAKKTE